MPQKVNVLPERKVITFLDNQVSASGTANTLTSSICATDSFSRSFWLFNITAKTGAGVTPDSYTTMLAFGDSAAAANMYNFMTLCSNAFTTAAVTFATETSILANHVRIEMVTKGCSATALYTITVKAICNNGI